jgi:hypothetical protein
VFGPPGHDDPERLKELLSKHDQVPRWAGERHLVLSDGPEGLIALESVLNDWRVDPVIGHMLSNEVGLYLGGMIVETIEGAHWAVWPNGHPVVRLSSNRDIDVTDLVSQRLQGKGRSLPDVYAQALNG